MRLILTAVSGSREGKVFTIEPSECLSFGRTNLSKWSFEDDGHMSSVHFEVVNLGMSGEVRDHNSTNGTWLNNEKISTAPLRDGDRIRAGKTILTVEFIPDLVPAVIVDPNTNLDEVEQTQAPTPVEELEFDGAALDVRRSETAENPVRDTSFEPLPAPPSPLGSRKNNPFDSVDFAELSPPPQPTPVSVHPQNRKQVFSPISDSSFIGSSSLPKRSNYELYSRLTSAEAADSFAILLDTLVLKWSAQLVVHFQKIRIATPVECESKPILRDLSHPAEASFMPARLTWSDTNSTVVMPLLPRLCRSDACLVFFGRSANEIGSQLDSMASMGVEGFSEPNGFLPYFWPSNLISIVDARGKEVCDQLFGGKIAGVLLCAPFSRNEIFAIGDDDFSEGLLAASFRPTKRLAAE